MQSADTLTALERLARLRAEGVLTQAEFEDQKRLLLSSAGEPVGRLRSADDIVKRGELRAGGRPSNALLWGGIFALALVVGIGAVAAMQRQGADPNRASTPAESLQTLGVEARTMQPAVTGAASEPRLGRCHMDSCSWSRELSRTEIGRDAAGGRLVRVVVLGGETGNDANAAPRDAAGSIVWNQNPHEVHVFCSSRTPAVIFAGSPPQVTLLDLRPGGVIPGVYESDLSFYAATCHNDVTSSAEELVRRHGYSARPEAYQSNANALRSPADILRWHVALVRRSSDMSLVTDAGLGPVRIGMTESAALAALGSGWEVQTLGRDLVDEQACHHIGRSGEDDGIGFMVEDGRITRVEVGTPENGVVPRVRTPSGIGIGATEADVRRTYGDAVVGTAHTYEEAPAQYLTVWTQAAPTSEEAALSPQARGVRFLTDANRRVVAILAGSSSITYVEGCL